MAVTNRKNDGRAAVLYVLGFAVRTLAVLLFLPASGTKPLLYWGTLGFTLAVYTAISAGVRAGYRGVKLLLVALVAGQAAMQLPNLVGSTTPRGATALELLALGLELGAACIILKDLFTPAPATKNDA
jgi:hypothetical protein